MHPLFRFYFSSFFQSNISYLRRYLLFIQEEKSSNRRRTPKNIHTVYTRILAERKTHNNNAEIVGSEYTRITIITLRHLLKITILTQI